MRQHISTLVKGSKNGAENISPPLFAGSRDAFAPAPDRQKRKITEPPAVSGSAQATVSPVTPSAGLAPGSEWFR